MTASSMRTLGNALLLADVLLLLIVVLGMSGVIPRLPGTNMWIIFALILGILARGLRRRSRNAPMPASPDQRV